MPTFTSLLPIRLIKTATRGLRGPLLAALLAIVIAVPCALMLPPIDRDEARFAQASSQMLESHDYININLQNVPRHKKPVGIYWLQALSVKLTTGVGAREIFPYRLPSILGIALAAFACAWGAGNAFGTRTGTKAGLLFAVMFMASTEAFFARSDAVLCGLITLFMAAMARIYLTTRDLGPDDPRPRLRREKLILWLAMAGAILVKGPEAAMVMGLTLLTLGIWDRKWRWMKNLSFGWGLILVLAICGPWAIAITVTTDGAFWGHAIGGDLASKFEGGSEGHFAWPGYHTLLLPIILFPASWLLGGAIQTAISRRHEAAIRFAIAWFVPTFVFFECLPTKLPHYTLPALGALIWLCAVSLDVPLKGWAKAVNWVAGLIGGLILAAGAILAFHQFGAPWSVVLVGLTAVSALGLAATGAWLLWRQHPKSGLGLLLAAGVGVHLGFWGLAASLTPLWVSNQMRQALVIAHLDPRQGIAPGPVAVLGYAEPSFVFAMGTKTQLLDTDADGAVSALNDGRPLFVESRYEKPFLAAAATQGITPRVVAKVNGHNYSNNQNVVLTLYDNPPPPPAQAPDSDAGD